MKTPIITSKLLKRIFLIAVVLGLLYVNVFLETYKIDNTSLSLLIVLVLLVLLPDYIKIFEKIKKLKIGDNEIEIEHKINELEKKVVNLSVDKLENNIPDNVINNIKQGFSNQRSTLITIGIEIEKRILELVEINGITKNPGFFSPKLMLDKLIDNNVINSSIKELFLDFWKIRNMASHSYNFDYDDSRLNEIANIGFKLLVLLYK